jgi:hypothetical protein
MDGRGISGQVYTFTEMMQRGLLLVRVAVRHMTPGHAKVKSRIIKRASVMLGQAAVERARASHPGSYRMGKDFCHQIPQATAQVSFSSIPHILEGRESEEGH